MFFFRYYAKKYNDQVQEKLQDQLGKSFSAGPSINTEKENEKSSIDDTETKDSIEVRFIVLFLFLSLLQLFDIRFAKTLEQHSRKVFCNGNLRKHLETKIVR